MFRVWGLGCRVYVFRVLGLLGASGYQILRDRFEVYVFKVLGLVGVSCFQILRAFGWLQRL